MLTAALRLHSLAMAGRAGAGNVLSATDWTIVGGDEVGVSGGKVLKVGAGYATLSLRKVSDVKSGYDLAGGAVEAGLGVGLQFKGIDALGKIIKSVTSAAGNAKLDYGLPGGTLGPLYYGLDGKVAINRATFENSPWFYASVGGMSAIIGVDGGIICLLKKPWEDVKKAMTDTVASMIPGAGALYVLLSNTIAWGLHGGMAIGIGIEVGVSGKVIQIVSVTDKRD